MTLTQIATLWSDGDLSAATVQMKQLARIGAVELSPKSSQHERRTECLFRWSVSDPKPNIAELMESRLPSPPGAAFDVFTTTRFTANLFASEFTTFPTPEERPEQLRLSDAYVAHRSPRSTEASVWFNRRAGDSEASGQIVPEVLFSDSQGRPIKALSPFTRSAQKLNAVHNFCAGKEIPYELW